MKKCVHSQCFKSWYRTDRQKQDRVLCEYWQTQPRFIPACQKWHTAEHIPPQRRTCECIQVSHIFKKSLVKPNTITQMMKLMSYVKKRDNSISYMYMYNCVCESNELLQLGLSKIKLQCFVCQTQNFLFKNT